MTVLLLHEDYPDELPVFGPNITSRGSGSSTSGYSSSGSGGASGDNGSRVCDQHKSVVVINGSSSSSSSSSTDSRRQQQHHVVVCVLGAVRDTSDREVDTLQPPTTYYYVPFLLPYSHHTP